MYAMNSLLGPLMNMNNKTFVLASYLFRSMEMDTL